MPFGTGSFETLAARRPARRGIYGLLAVGAVAIAVMVWWYNNNVKPGRIELTTTPVDATVLIDNVKVGDKSPLSIERSPGPYTLSVTRDGYARNDQNIELKAGQPLALTVTLEPSPDTGFELTSDPPGGLVWLDGAAVKETSGQQARTNFRASRIGPGHHVLEIRGERFKPWQQDVEIEPGQIRKVHAMLIPAVGGPGGAVAKQAPPPVTPPTTPSQPSGKELAMGPPTTPVSPPGGGTQAPPATPPTSPPGAGPGGSGSGSANVNGKKASGGGATPGGGSGSVASPGGGSTTPPTPGTGTSKRRRAREAPAGDDGTDTGGGDDTPAAKKTVASDDAAGGGGDCSITINSIPWSEV